ncbi:hypothetical protein AAFF_G00094680 [Aldrovandia affinis]|uniref:Uncharacterized protein n=1 Tax=Aldrovandia affinis TaxID=143900 RepID=A0AAD7WY39_9TELE|nr:hypothetical protein AAFF_G00094680 [Aldrovandia affinis]
MKSSPYSNARPNSVAPTGLPASPVTGPGRSRPCVIRSTITRGIQQGALFFNQGIGTTHRPPSPQLSRDLGRSRLHFSPPSPIRGSPFSSDPKTRSVHYPGPSWSFPWLLLTILFHHLKGPVDIGSPPQKAPAI